MSLLDDLRNQAEGKKAAEEEAAARKAEREQFYQEKTLPRMIKAYQFFNEFVAHLNYIKLETIVNYPLLPDGRQQALRQEGYNVVIDSSKALKHIDFSMEGVLDEPLQFEIFGKDAVLKHTDRIERYGFRYERKDKKDSASMELIGANFILHGPLPLKVMMEADVDAMRIKVTFRNFQEPGFTKYNLTVEQFSDEFLDQLGKFILRQEDRLFGKSEELSEEARKKLRDRMIVEARIREQEMIEAEERRKAEEAAEREKSAKEQIKRVVNTQKEQLKRVMNTQVAKGKESLKGIFDKLKKQAQARQQTSPESISPTEPAQFQQQVTTNRVMSAQPTSVPPTNLKTASKPASPASPATVQTAAKKTQPPKVYNAPPNNPFLKPEPPDAPPVDAAEQISVPSAPVKREILQPSTAEVPAQSSSVPPASLKTTPKPTGVAVSKPANPASLATVQTAAKKTQPPKVYNAPPNNPFLKPEPPDAPPIDATETVKAPAATDRQMPPVQSTKTIPPASIQPTKPAHSHQQVTTNRVMSAQPTSVPPANLKTASKPAGVADSKPASPASPVAVQTTAKKTQPPKAYNAPPNNPFLKPEPPEEPPVDTSEPEAKAATAPLELEAIPEVDLSPRPDVTPDVAIALPVDTSELEAKAATAPLELEAIPETDMSPRPDVTPDVAIAPPVDTSEPEAKAATAPLELEAIPEVDMSPRPDVTPDVTIAPAVDTAGRGAKTAPEQPNVEAAPAADTSSHRDLTPESLEEDLARIIERDKQTVPQQTPISNKTTNPSLQTQSTKVATQTGKPPVAKESPGSCPKSDELKTRLSDVTPITSETVNAKDTEVSEAKDSTQNLFLNSEELDIDLSDSVVPPQNNDSKEHS